MKRTILAVCLITVAGSLGSAETQVTGQGQAFVASPQNSGCEQMDPGSVQQGTASAQTWADQNARKQCGSSEARRTSDYTLTHAIKYRGAGCLITAAASYTCGPRL